MAEGLAVAVPHRAAVTAEVVVPPAVAVGAQVMVAAEVPVTEAEARTAADTN